MLTKKELKEIRDMLISTKKLMVFFDSDADGCCSFLLLYRFAKDYCEDIRGVLVSPSELKDEVFIDMVKNYDPDTILVLDKPMVSQDFIDSVKKPIYWLDHHPLQKRSNVKYYNPLKKPDKKYLNGAPDSRPTTYWAYKVVEEDRPQDLWLVMAGCISDWFVPEFTKEFSKKYPDLVSDTLKIRNPGDVLFGTKLGKLCRIINFMIKYPTKDSMINVKILSRINDPYEVLDQTSSQGKYLYKQYQKVNIEYEKIRKTIKNTKDRLLLLVYECPFSIGADLSTDIKHHFPKKLILIAKIKGDSYVCSFRSEQFNVREILEKSLVGIDGFGGGHKFACGASVKVPEWDKFLTNFKAELKKAKIEKQKN
jgi:single-stranded DNA-specific DHH superfamily exonuclease